VFNISVQQSVRFLEIIANELCHVSSCKTVASKT
jgi:hypothetical protein